MPPGIGVRVVVHPECIRPVIPLHVLRHFHQALLGNGQRQTLGGHIKIHLRRRRLRQHITLPCGVIPLTKVVCADIHPRPGQPRVRQAQCLTVLRRHVQDTLPDILPVQGEVNQVTSRGIVPVKRRPDLRINAGPALNKGHVQLFTGHRCGTGKRRSHGKRQGAPAKPYRRNSPGG